MSFASNFGPKRESRRRPDGSYQVRCTPPVWSGFGPSEIVLTAKQFARFERWLAGEGMIHELLADLSDGAREVLLSGINEKEYDNLAEKHDAM